MREIVVKKVSTLKDKEKGLRVSSNEGNLDLLPKGSSELPVQSANGVLVLELIQVDGDSRIIRGKGWRDFIRHYDLGATVTLYLDDNGNYKLEARNEPAGPSR